MLHRIEGPANGDWELVIGSGKLKVTGDTGDEASVCNWDGG